MKTVKMFGKRVPILAILILIICTGGVAYGAVVNYLSNKVEVTTTIESPIVVSGTILYGKGVLRWSEYDGVEACTSAADRLLALQSKTDYGWDWDVTGLTGHSDESSAPNLYGVTALGLIDAYLLTKNEAYLTTATDLADYMTSGDPSSGDFWNDGWGYSFDYRFLVRLSEIIDEPSYRKYAAEAWHWQKTSDQVRSDGTLICETYGDGRQETMYERLLAHYGTNGGAIWQAADYGLAALEMGDIAWAMNMADVIVSHINDIDPTNDEEIYEIIGWGKALEFLSKIDSLTYSVEINTLINKLKDAQELDGHWDGGNTDGAVQDTTYAILGLLKAGELDIAQKAAYWLVTHQGYEDIPGGWLNDGNDGVEYSEITSEALQAIANTLMKFEPAREPVSFDTSRETSVSLGELKAGDTIIAIGTERNLANNPVTSVVAVVIPAPSEWTEGWTTTGDELTLYWRYPEASGWIDKISFGSGWRTITIDEKSYAVILVGGYFDNEGKVVGGAGSMIPAGESLTVEVRIDFAQNVAPGKYTMKIFAVNPGTSLEAIPTLFK